MATVRMQHPARQFGGLIDSFFNELNGFTPQAQVSNSQAPVNIVETTDAYHMELVAPGRTRESFKISVENGLLTISYEAPKEEGQPEFKQIRKEFKLTSFTRKFTLDETIEADGIQAKYENGLLKVFLPKKAEVKSLPKEIVIQ
ncbi:Hsp20/alpha crystallin family protein [Flavihumibacter rivuli]|uniref:Hsp20/alpha crystallin family protein n=1 Tax=Flavihumibacter rivuli TaxID=2838156 RepID=UPI001BDE20BC|nr:Hsp20/alpha crystallin family protein [Flavihumibacter rivuli]ULQ57530.1 Hsp20/alpha crystallin family protein [Flavihumibacter rivuli]